MKDAKFEERAKACDEFNKTSRWRKRAISASELLGVGFYGVGIRKSCVRDKGGGSRAWRRLEI